MSYPVPAQRTRVETRAGNSRFIATIARATTQTEARQFIQSIRAEMPDATHHVYAFIAGHGASVTEGMSDDGEPAGTSGPPALAVLRGSGLGDVVLVITRYFGGTKLGTGGLVAAYGAAAKAAVEAVPRENYVPRTARVLRMPYPLYDRVCQLLLLHEALAGEAEFSDEVSLKVLWPNATLPQIAAILPHGCQISADSE